MVTSNVPFNEWTEIFGSERLTGALLDRLTHHVHILEMNGESYRLQQSKRSRKRSSSVCPPWCGRQLFRGASTTSAAAFTGVPRLRSSPRNSRFQNPRPL